MQYWLTARKTGEGGYCAYRIIHGQIPKEGDLVSAVKLPSGEELMVEVESVKEYSNGPIQVSLKSDFSEIDSIAQDLRWKYF